MNDENRTYALIYLSEREATQLASAVQILIHELGYEPDEVVSSYHASFAYFMNEHQGYKDQGSTEKHSSSKQVRISA